MSIMNTWNLATKFAAFPCAQPDPVIIAATFLPAVTPALLEWVTFGCRDVMKFRLGRETPCGRSLKGDIAKAMSPKWANAAGTLLKFEAKFSFAGQMWLLADLISDTLARWTTLSYQMSGCPDALNMASWDITFSAPEALLGGHPTIIGGTVTNERGALGIAWPTGAIVPPGWYASGYFELHTKPLLGDDVSGADTWIRSGAASGFDFPATRTSPGYPGQSATNVYHLEVHNEDEHHEKQLTMMAMTDKTSLTTDLSASWMAAPFPLTTSVIKPLGCLENLFTSHVEDPAGTNPKKNWPKQIDKWLGQQTLTPTRGPPGGRPRSKK